ncbi:MAG: peptidoglycan DD-metalloendopeptidase family protein [Sandaracinaceae bacterium]|nr:peptidoglycan DD-metalloendopeptidase family protein [Sandaracinaceae bacterium]
MRRLASTTLGATALALAGLLLGGPASGQVTPDVGVATREVATVRAERERAQTEVAALRAQQSNARRRLRERVRMLHRLRRAGSLPMASGFDAVLRHQARVARLERLVGRDARAFQTIGRRVSELEAEETRLESAERDSEARLVALRREEDERQSEMQLIEQMMEDPAAWVGPSMGMGQGFGIRLSDAPARGYQLAQERGRLPLPVGGSAQVRDAEREGGAGLEIITSAGVSVRAVGPGTVSYASTHPAYGRLVIVDHGDGHYTVYGGLGAITTRSGSPIEREAVLGAVGPQPVFFQVRRGTRPLPAREWLGI